MLNIYYGRESIDKEKFIYERIAEKQGRTLVIVPDQYTLEAEKRGFSASSYAGAAGCGNHQHVQAGQQTAGPARRQSQNFY